MKTGLLSWTDERKLVRVHPDLRRLVRVAADGSIPFKVVEGLRTEARQSELVQRGASTTMNSRHLTGHAVDLVPLIAGKPSWHWPHYYPFAEHVKDVAARLAIPVEWGGDWQRFKDGPHWQLPWNTYPIATKG